MLLKWYYKYKFFQRVTECKFIQYTATGELSLPAYLCIWMQVPTIAVDKRPAAAVATGDEPRRDRPRPSFVSLSFTPLIVTGAPRELHLFTVAGLSPQLWDEKSSFDNNSAQKAKNFATKSKSRDDKRAARGRALNYAPSHSGDKASWLTVPCHSIAAFFRAQLRGLAT